MCLLCTNSFSQDETPAIPGSSVEQQLENLAEQDETETEDDSFLQSLIQFRKNKINLNTTDAGELRELKILTDLQIQNFLRYRQLLGNFINIYELQAIPTWDVETIQKILQYIRIGSAVSLAEELKGRFLKGQHSILIRAQQVLETSEGFARPDSIENRYLGSRQRVFFRYKYVYRNLLQYGLVGDKDAGEQFFKGNQKNGFDFYSFHLFARKMGPVKLLALGDFTVNMGQGLIQWQSQAFKKSPDVTAVKRQADILRPYNSATEYNFQRGAGITIKSNKIEATAFGSIRSVDANFQADTIVNTDDFVSSILTTGYHRTPNEIAKKNTIEQTSFGGNVSYNGLGLHLGVNAVAFHFSTPLIRDVQPYNQYAIQGTDWRNYSVDYSYTYRNLHFFGEVAMDKNNSKALVSGLIASLDPKVDASLVYRNIEKTYQALYANAFTEGTYPTNEKGLFAGFTIKPIAALRLDAYADIFTFPWLRYRLDAPSQGSDYFAQLTYRPNKQVEVYTRYKNESKAINISGLNLPTRQFFVRPRQNWRTQVSYKVSREVTLRNRVELLWYDPREKERKEQGFVTYFDAAYRPFGKPFSTNARLLYFETDGFDSRIYTFENDVLYSFSIPAFFDKGYRYYLNVSYDVNKKMTCWARYAQTINTGKTTVGSGLDQLAGDTKSEVKFQVIYNF
jgi:hypothetical protein